MLTFAEYKRQATAFGSNLEDRDDWIVLSEVDRHRESEAIEVSNHICALKALGGESDTVEIWRFGHWAVGWIEHIAVHPSRRADAQAIADRLADHTILDEDDVGEREHEEACQWWQSSLVRDFADQLQSEYDLRDSTWEYIVNNADCAHYVFENEAPYVLSTEGSDVYMRVDRIESRAQLAGLLRKLRAEVKDSRARQKGEAA